MKNLQIAIAILVTLLIVAYNIRLHIIRKKKDRFKTYHVTMYLKPGEKHLANDPNSQLSLTETGMIIEKTIIRLHSVSSKISVKDYTILPDRVQLLLSISDANDELLEPLKINLHSVIKVLFKTTSKEIGRDIWIHEVQSRIVDKDSETK